MTHLRRGRRMRAASQKSNALEQQVPFVSPKQLPENSTARPQTAPGATEEARPARNRHQRVRVGESEVDIEEDVNSALFRAQTGGCAADRAGAKRSAAGGPLVASA